MSHTESRRNHGSAAMLMLVLIVLSVSMGCSSTESNNQAFMEKFKNLPSVPPRVVLGPGDEVEFKFYTTPELDELQRVRPDGMITLQLVGEVKVEGKTPSEVSEELKQRYAQHLQKPEVAVIVRSLVNSKVFVGGEVMQPGLVEMPARLTALEAIIQAGGFNVLTAECSNVVIIRHKDGKRYGCALDFDKALAGEMYEPFFLEPHDIVYVPQTTIVKITQWIDQHINRIIPLGFTLTQDRGNTTVGFSKYGAVGSIR
ncbi:MAG: polysaccharide biosynthesis/export family protein [Planctomycetota bacterium]